MKLSKTNIIKLKEKARDLNNGAVRLFLFVAMNADETGMAQGIYYKEFCEKTGMCNQSFYNAKEKLLELGFIQEYKRDNKDIDIMLLDNKFVTREDYKKGYLDLNRVIFENKKFWKLTDNAMIMLLDFLKNSLAAVNSTYRIGRKKLYENYKRYFNVSTSRICSYLRELKAFFSIGTKDGITYIRPFVEIIAKGRETTANSTREHKTKMVIRRARAIASSEVIRDLQGLICQYRDEAIEQGKDIIMLLQNCVMRSVWKLKGSERILNAAYIHKIIREELGLL